VRNLLIIAAINFLSALRHVQHREKFLFAIKHKKITNKVWDFVCFCAGGQPGELCPEEKFLYKEKVNNVWAIFQKYVSEMGAFFLPFP
jgi:hypothetical protein